MRYMLLVYLDEQALDEAERDQCYGESVQLTNDLNSSRRTATQAPIKATG